MINFEKKRKNTIHEYEVNIWSSIIDGHRGKIHVESKLRAGTEVIIELPKSLILSM